MKTYKLKYILGTLIVLSQLSLKAQWFLTGNAPNTTNFLGSTNNEFLRIRTNNLPRMKISPNSSYQVNLLPTQARNGHVLIGNDGFSSISNRNLFDNNFGAYSLLHLNGEGTFVEDWGYRNWMRTGITLTGNRDLTYFGLRKLSTTPSDEDITETTIAWADNNGTGGFSSDDLAFRFINGRTDGVNNLFTSDDLDGLHIARFTSSGRIGFGNTFGINATGMTPTVPYVAPQNLLHMSLSGNRPVFIQITNRDSASVNSGTGETANDGLHIGIPQTSPNNKPGIFSNREDDRIEIRTNEQPSNTGERIRVMHTGALNAGVAFNPGGLATNLTRIGISHNPSSPVTRPLSLLHLGYNTANASTNDGWRSWMDVGMFASQNSDHVYLGLDTASNGADAVLAWGDNNFPDAAGPDNFRMVFTSTLGGTANPANTANGVEGMRMTPSFAEGISTGIGGDPTSNPYRNGVNPTGALEVNGWGNTNPQGGNSGLSFTNLDANTTPLPTNPGSGVLGVDLQGRVVYVPANNNPPFGNNCGATQVPLPDDFEIPLDGLSYNFTAAPNSNDNSRVNIGNLPCGLPFPARLVVVESEPIQGAIVHTAIIGATDATNLPIDEPVYGIMGNISNTQSFDHAGVFGRSENAYGDYDAVGVFGVAVNSDRNIGVKGRAQTTNANRNVGVWGEATGADENYGGYFSAPSSSNNTLLNYAGLFVGDVMITGDGWVNGGTLISSDSMFKRSIDTITNPLNIIKQLKPHTYFLDTANPYGIKFSNKRQYGLIAQDVEQLLPEVIGQATKPNIYDSLGNIVAPSVTYKSLNYNAFIGILIAAMQKQQGQIEAKDSTIASLNDRLTALETCVYKSNLCSKKVKKSLMEENEEANTNSHTTEITLTDLQYIVLDQNVPNPFAEQTAIGYFLPEDIKKAQVVFHNADGKLINSLTITERGRGSLNVYADDLSSGVYSYTLIADGKVIDTKRMVKN